MIRLVLHNIYKVFIVNVLKIIILSTFGSLWRWWKLCKDFGIAVDKFLRVLIVYRVVARLVR